MSPLSALKSGVSVSFLTKMEIISKLGIGPMSSEVIEAAFRFSEQSKEPLMLISSRNQIDWNGGYVNRWTTRQYTTFVESMRRKYSGGRIYLCRDHCGPVSVQEDLTNVYQTIDEDIESGFDLIHIDFCHYSQDEQVRLKASKIAINYIARQNPQVLIEVGTDENSGRDFRDLKSIERQMGYFSSFCSPHFYVGQTGSLVKELGQRGIFQEGYVREMHQLAGRYGMALKEHNADYLTAEQIGRRKGLVDAVNVAPQYGVLQTNLTIQKCLVYGIDFREFLEKSYQSEKWRKWLEHANPEDKHHCAIIAGHYIFSDDSYKRLSQAIGKYEDFSETIIDEMMRNFQMYVESIK